MLVKPSSDRLDDREFHTDVRLEFSREVAGVASVTSTWTDWPAWASSGRRRGPEPPCGNQTFRYSTLSSTAFNRQAAGP